MTIQDAETFQQITETAPVAIDRLYTTSQPKDAVHVVQQHAMALDMIIVRADRSSNAQQRAQKTTRAMPCATSIGPQFTPDKLAQ